MEKYKSFYPTIRQAKTKWSKPSIVAKQGEGPSHDWYEMLKKDARAKLAASIHQSKFGSVSHQQKIVHEESEAVKDKIGKPTPSAEEIAKKHNLSVDQINAQIKKGIEVEKEHTNDEAEAHEIARDHLDEFPDYYDRLGRMEKVAKKEMKEDLGSVQALLGTSAAAFVAGATFGPSVEYVKNKLKAKKLLQGKAKPKKLKEENKNRPKQELPPKKPHPVPKGFKRVKEGSFNVLKKVNEEVPNSVGGGNIAGMPTHSTPDQTPVRGPLLRRKKFAGKTVFVVKPDTFYKSYLGKRRYEHYEKFLEGCEGFEEIRDYGRKYWDEPIILENEITGAMVYLKYGSR